MLQRFNFVNLSGDSYPTERVLSVKGKVRFESQGPPRLGEVVARKALEQGGGIQKSERERTKIGLTLTSLKSSAFVNLQLVINGPNEFAKDHQAQTH